MASLQVRLQDLATRIATEAKSLRTLINGNAGNLNALTTTAKGNLVAAVNELVASIAAVQAASGAQINDSSNSSASQTYSINKIKTEISTAVASLVNGSAAALDTLAELAGALGNDANFAATISASLGNRVRVDAVQSLSAPQQAQARDNIGALAAAAVGEPDTDFVAVFNSGLV